MINKLTLKNFQSHRLSELEFHPGVNSIVGESDKGKTAILRSLYWIINNRPLGNAFISFWNRDKNGGPKRQTAVTISSPNGTISRIKSDKFNGYEINENALEAVRADVPDEVSQFLNLSEVNVQKQMDSPFLLSESPGEVARFFNRIIRLDLIDRALSNAESERRKLNAEDKMLKNELALLEDHLKGLDWIGRAERVLSRIESTHARVEGDRASMLYLMETISQMSIEQNRIDDMEALLQSSEGIVYDIEQVQEVRDQSVEQKSDLEALINQIKDANSVIEHNALISGLSDLCQEIIEHKAKMDLLIPECEELDKLIYSITECHKQIEMAQSAIESHQASLPDTCPLCGQMMGEDHAEC